MALLVLASPSTKRAIDRFEERIRKHSGPLSSICGCPPEVLANCRQQNLFQRTKGDLVESVTKFAVSLAELEDGL